MTLTLVETLAALPRSLWIPILAGFAVPVLATAARLRLFRKDHASLVAQFAARASVLVTATLALVGAIGIANSARLGLEGVLPAAEGLAALVRPEAERAWQSTTTGHAALPAALTGALGVDGRIRLIAAGPFPCSAGCAPAATDAVPPAELRALLSQFHPGQPGRTASVARVRGEALALGRAPLRDANGTPTGIVVVAIDTGPVIGRATRLAWELLWGSVAIAVVAVAGFATAVRRYFSQRLDALLALLQSPRSEPTTPEARDEFTRLSATVTRLVDHAVALEGQLQDARRTETVGRLAAGVAHEFNNLMTTVIGHAEMAAFTLPPAAPERQDLAAIRDSARRAATLTSKLLQYSGRQIDLRRPVDLGDVVGRALPALRAAVASTNEVRVAIDPGLVVLADEAHITQLLVELADNAGRVMPPSGSLTITAAAVHHAAPIEGPGIVAPPGDYACLAVHDTGRGIPADVLPRIFDPFFSTRPMHAAAGLGLAAVLGIVQAHKGALQVDSATRAGTTFRIYLPLASPADAAAR